MSVVGRDFYGVFPLKGKPLNVREAKHAQITSNAEIQNIIKIMGVKRDVQCVVHVLEYVYASTHQDHCVSRSPLRSPAFAKEASP